jgi:hypothetical protein
MKVSLFWMWPNFFGTKNKHPEQHIPGYERFKMEQHTPENDGRFKLLEYLLIPASLYLIISFVSLEIDFRDWTQATRVIFLISTCFFSIAKFVFSKIK